jgi:hypothetical protein
LIGVLWTKVERHTDDLPCLPAKVVPYACLAQLNRFWQIALDVVFSDEGVGRTVAHVPLFDVD